MTEKIDYRWNIEWQTSVWMGVVGNGWIWSIVSIFSINLNGLFSFEDKYLFFFSSISWKILLQEQKEDLRKKQRNTWDARWRSPIRRWSFFFRQFSTEIRFFIGWISGIYFSNWKISIWDCFIRWSRKQSNAGHSFDILENLFWNSVRISFDRVCHAGLRIRIHPLVFFTVPITLMGGLLVRDRYRRRISINWSLEID